MSQVGGESVLETIDLLIEGYVTPQRAEEISRQYPTVRESLSRWIERSAAQRNWRRVERLANLAARLNAPGLGSTLIKLLDSHAEELNHEDLVEILGEIREEAAATALFRLVERSIESDAPAYWLCQKAISSLGELGSDEADGFLSLLTEAGWPAIIRWHAAVELNVEDDLGFDEDQMLG